VLAVYGPHLHPDAWAIQATSYALPGFPETGITWLAVARPRYEGTGADHAAPVRAHGDLRTLR
jgi:hypothetical protein